MTRCAPHSEQHQTAIPQGFSEWYGLVDPTTYQYYDYKLSENGTIRQYGHAPGDYQTDVLARRAVEVIGRTVPHEAPLFLTLAPLAPHTQVRNGIGENPIPAPRHSSAFPNAHPDKALPYNEADVSDKPSWIRGLPSFTPAVEDTITQRYRAVLRSLLAVDEAVGQMVAALKATGELDRTMFVFTSDNGLFFGEHRITYGKRIPYEAALRVPLMIRAPGLGAERGAVSHTLVTNADLPATLMDVAGADPARPLDGRSLLPLLKNPAEV
ncbi:hypothetical protein BG844_10655 [Couchioplanes caeruleus subsp. caeruleus]|uniref:Sulfatase N-terminal domain-containing protein n=1 Tax=Couchioplanes caeruleus subsp. caeruleus TaxID=56427 RepID=A0A1K0GXX3_9ACTN|nr:sulfatase-like hydrolase/transferase [Couchioplanes caeruleus]OJF14283.1 hypothetical protein BG844_10655 [Couchioplanes caeruleus subsp. caeruleus]